MAETTARELLDDLAKQISFRDALVALFSAGRVTVDQLHLTGDEIALLLGSCGIDHSTELGQLLFEEAFRKNLAVVQWQEIHMCHPKDPSYEEELGRIVQKMAEAATTDEEWATVYFHAKDQSPESVLAIEKLRTPQYQSFQDWEARFHTVPAYSKYLKKFTLLEMKRLASAHNELIRYLKYYIQWNKESDRCSGGHFDDFALRILDLASNFEECLRVAPLENAYIITDGTWFTILSRAASLAITFEDWGKIQQIVTKTRRFKIWPQIIEGKAKTAKTLAQWTSVFQMAKSRDRYDLARTAAENIIELSRTPQEIAPAFIMFSELKDQILAKMSGWQVSTDAWQEILRKFGAYTDVREFVLHEIGKNFGRQV